MAAKTDDVDIKVKIASLASPGKAKRFGRKIVLKENWENLRISYMRRILEIKFIDPLLMEKLRKTGSNVLIEGNAWGECPIGTGKNNLGKILMAIRDDITR